MRRHPIWNAIVALENVAAADAAKEYPSAAWDARQAEKSGRAMAEIRAFVARLEAAERVVEAARSIKGVDAVVVHRVLERLEALSEAIDAYDATRGQEATNG